MAVPHKNASSSATALAAAVLALSHFLLLATGSSDAYGLPATAPCSPTPRQTPTTPKSAPGGRAKCPVNPLSLGACAGVLGGLVSLELGQRSASSSSGSSTGPCCQLLGGLVDLDAAVCLCTALQANVLGVVQLSLPVELGVVVSFCGKKVPQGFQCPS